MLQFSIVTLSVFVTVINDLVIYVSEKCFKKDIKHFIPIVSLCVGAILSLCGYFTTDIEMGNTWIDALFTGLAAGASAVGVNQVGKQLYKANQTTAFITDDDNIDNFIDEADTDITESNDDDTDESNDNTEIETSDDESFDNEYAEDE